MSELNTYHIYALSERAAVLSLGNIIDEAVNDKVLAMHAWLKEHNFPGLKDMVPAYSSLTVLYDAGTGFNQVKQQLERAWAAAGEQAPLRTNIIPIPVCYDPVFGYDLAPMATAKGMSVDELVQLHCSKNYRVYMLGFLPGFAYMGTVDERLVMPRKPAPQEVEAGSVGIAGAQTGIYPLSSPGGWHIIGRTPLK
ncbi:MAG TPA: 5-oxoprolinase subunit PxpB, partial [Chitinophagaceae bacterium]|nr:5-oxoprolinase subunit PxpB [Chitinophagaceae bacterium]